MNMKINVISFIAIASTTSNIIAMDADQMARNCEQIARQQAAMRQQLNTLEAQSSANLRGIQEVKSEANSIFNTLNNLTEEQKAAIRARVANAGK